MDQKPSDESATVTGPRHIWNAAGYSVSGLRAALHHEAAFRQELAIAAVLLVVAVVLPAKLTQTALLVLAIVIVLLAELVNYAIKAVVDHTSTDRHPLAKRAKDVGSAAVLVALVSCVLIWGLVLVEIYG